jgi:hypothetical protein
MNESPVRDPPGAFPTRPPQTRTLGPQASSRFFGDAASRFGSRRQAGDLGRAEGGGGTYRNSTLLHKGQSSRFIASLRLLATTDAHTEHGRSARLLRPARRPLARQPAFLAPPRRRWPANVEPEPASPGQAAHQEAHSCGRRRRRYAACSARRPPDAAVGRSNRLWRTQEGAARYQEDDLGTVQSNVRREKSAAFQGAS